MTSVSAEDRIFHTQVIEYARGDGFLSDIGMTGSVDEPSLMTPGKFLFGVPNNEHFR